MWGNGTKQKFFLISVDDDDLAIFNSTHYQKYLGTSYQDDIIFSGEKSMQAATAGGGKQITSVYLRAISSQLRRGHRIQLN